VALAVDARRLDKQRLVYEVALELFGYAQAEAVDAIEGGRRVSGTVRLAVEVADSEDMARRHIQAGAAS
jgi:hypothetical protein